LFADPFLMSYYPAARAQTHASYWSPFQGDGLITLRVVDDTAGQSTCDVRLAAAAGRQCLKVTAARRHSPVPPGLR
jgi:hypothetical protein